MMAATTEATFSAYEAAAVSGLSYRQLDYAARTDVLRPTGNDAKGSGSRRRYTYRDLLALRVLAILREFSGSRALQHHNNALRIAHEAAMEHYLVVRADGRAKVSRTPWESVADPAIIISLWAVRSHVDAQVADIHHAQTA